MKHAQAHARRRAIGAFLHRWHRRFGVAVCAFVVWLALTGWALNHSASLGLAATRIGAPWLTHWYGLRDTTPFQGYHHAEHWLVTTEESATLDGRALRDPLPRALGLTGAGNLLFAANATTLVVLDANGSPIDRLAAADIGLGEITRLGSTHDAVVVEGPQAKQLASRDGISWAPYIGSVSWSAAVELPPLVRTRAQYALRPTLPLERVMEDAHSGRIFGRYGPLVVDLVGLIFAALALSGLWMFLRRRWRPGSHSSHQHSGSRERL